VKDDLVDVAGFSRETLFEQRFRVSGVGVGEAKDVGVGRTLGVGDHVDQDEEQYPGAEHEPTTADTKVSEGSQKRGSPEGK
jgi:hypothetical protein